MLSWLYDVFMTIITFVMGLFGLDLKKRSVTFADDVKEDATNSVEGETSTAAIASVASVATTVVDVLAGATEDKDVVPVTESA